MIVSLVVAAVQEGYEVDVLATNPQFCSEVEAAGGRAIKHNFVRRQISPVRDAVGLLQLAWWLRKQSYDVVQTHTSKGGIVGRAAARIAGRSRVMHTVHGYAFHGASSLVARKAVVRLERLGARWCDLLVTVSESHREQTLRERIAPPHKVIAIANGVPAPRLFSVDEVAELRSTLGVGEPGKLVVYCGRLAPQKGLPHLVEAVQILAKREPTLRVVLAGDGPSGRELQSLTQELQLGCMISFLGFRSDVDRLMRASDIVVLPSLWEGMSIALLEAMANACTVITTSIPSNMEVVGASDCAAIVEPGDPLGLAQQIAALLGDEERRQELAHKAMRSYEQKYSVDVMCRRYLEIYDSLSSA